MRFFQGSGRPADEPAQAAADDASAVRVLLIDDDEDEFRLLRASMREIRTTRYELDWVPTYEQGLAAMRDGTHDAYLVDYRLGASSGVELIRAARAAGCERPLIMLTGQGSASVDHEALAAGATDFVEKGRNSGPVLERTLRYAISQAEMTAALRRTLRQVAGLEALSRLLAERGPTPDALDEAVRLLDEDFDLPQTSLYLMDEHDMLELAAVRGYPRPVSSIDPRSGRLATAIQAGRPQVVPNMTIDPYARTAADPMELCVPMLAEGACVGILNVALPEGGGNSDELAKPVRVMADRLAVALALNRAIGGRSFITPNSIGITPGGDSSYR